MVADIVAQREQAGQSFRAGEAGILPAGPRGH